MKNILDTFKNSFLEYGNYLINEIQNPKWDNYFYALIVISVIAGALEVIIPWRKNQKFLRKDFWLDLFYMFFNFFIFNLIAFVALSKITEQNFLKLLNGVGFKIDTFQLIQINDYNVFFRLLVFFLVTDFIQWLTHRALHASNFLWNFHKVHHSVKEMGFAAHLRYHWMETIIYKTALYIPLAIIGGFNVQDVIIIHFIAIMIGHLNHSNIELNYGFLKYVLNNPEMHIWHHAKELPKDRKYGVNFGISLSIWDYLFKTNYIPYNGRDIELGFENDTKFPKDFVQQEIYPLNKKD